MKVPQLKSILFELINETMFGHRFKIELNGKIYPALVSSNVANDIRGESPYRITWFDPTTMEPYSHIDFGKDSLTYILRYNKFPMSISIKYFKLGLPTPKIIAEAVRTGPVHPTAADILVGTIDPDDDYVEAKYGGSHQTLKCRTNRKGDFRFNDETRNVYWHEEHPKKYEIVVNDYIEANFNVKVNRHITLDRVRDNISAYTYYWNDAHGLEQADTVKF